VELIGNNRYDKYEIICLSMYCVVAVGSVISKLFVVFRSLYSCDDADIWIIDSICVQTKSILLLKFVNRFNLRPDLNVLLRLT